MLCTWLTLPFPQLTAPQLALMERTAAAVRSSSTPDVLQMRILAGHGADARFSFLRRGREQHWGAEWDRLLRGERVTLEEEKKGLLVGYDSDSEESEDGASGREGDGATAEAQQVAAAEERAAAPTAPGPPPTLPQESASKRPHSPEAADADALAAAKAARLQRAREWASKRRQELAEEASAAAQNEQSDV
jgi:hypothetical protein